VPSPRKIADEFRRHGLPTKVGRPWTHTTVARILERSA
jgi:hypothetical protein